MKKMYVKVKINLDQRREGSDYTKVLGSYLWSNRFEWMRMYLNHGCKYGILVLINRFKR